MPRLTTTLIIPYFNEGSTVAEVIRAGIRTNLIDEIIVVDDGSDTPCALEPFPNPPVPVSVIRLPKNSGDGRARSVGIECSRGSVIGFCDADLPTISVTGLHRLFASVLENECDVAIGSLRYPNGQEPRLNTYLAMPLLRRFASQLAVEINSPLSGIRVSRREFLFPDRIEPRTCMIGMTLDAWQAGANLREYDIGIIENPKRPVSEKSLRADMILEASLHRFQEWGLLSSPLTETALSLVV